MSSMSKRWNLRSIGVLVIIVIILIIGLSAGYVLSYHQNHTMTTSCVDSPMCVTTTTTVQPYNFRGAWYCNPSNQFDCAGQLSTTKINFMKVENGTLDFEFSNQPPSSVNVNISIEGGTTQILQTTTTCTTDTDLIAPVFCDVRTTQSINLLGSRDIYVTLSYRYPLENATTLSFTMEFSLTGSGCPYQCTTNLTE